MKTTLLFLFTAAFMLLMLPPAEAQSSTTKALHKKHSDALALFFYNNTLRMINQSEDREFDELIKDIEKMRFLLIQKAKTGFDDAAYTKLLSDYRTEKFEEILTSRHNGKHFNVLIRENNGKTAGMLVLINDTESLYVLDILGRIALDKITSLYDKLDKSTDLGEKIRQFTHSDDDADDDH